MSSPDFEAFWTQLKASLPPGAQQFKADMEKHTKMAMLKHFRALNLVTREEFDVQRKVLQQAIQSLKALEAKIDQNQA